MKYYGLRNFKTKEPLGFTYTANPPEAESNDVSFTFEKSEDNLWLVRYQDQAQKALNESPQWYNAGYSTPEWPSHLSQYDYEIFEVEFK